MILQVRPTADAFWPGAKEPWSRYLTGPQGGDPGYDPLAFAVTEAHRRGLQLHAWFNPYRISMDPKIDDLAPSHPARQHPDWVVPYGGKLYYNPGIPAAPLVVDPGAPVRDLPGRRTRRARPLCLADASNLIAVLQADGRPTTAGPIRTPSPAPLIW